MKNIYTYEVQKGDEIMHLDEGHWHVVYEVVEKIESPLVTINAVCAEAHTLHTYTYHRLDKINIREDEL